MQSLDSELLTRYATTRDAEAFAELMIRHRDLVYATCYRVLRSRADAEDVSQDCFLRLARHAGAIHTSVTGWLHRVAVQRSLVWIKRERSRLQREQEVANLADHSGEEATWEEIMSEVDRAIDRLPGKLREPLVLHFLGGRDQTSVALDLGVSQATVSRRINRAVERIRGDLKKSGFGISAAGLAVFLSTRTAEAAPASLAEALGKLALAGIRPGATTLALTAAFGAGRVLTGWKVKLTCVAVAALGGGFALHQAMRGSSTPLRAQLRAAEETGVGGSSLTSRQRAIPERATGSGERRIPVSLHRGPGDATPRRFVAAKAGEAPQPKASALPFGRAVGGLTARLTPGQTTYQEGQNVWLYLDVRNVGDEPLKVAWGRTVEARLRLTSATGEARHVTKPVVPNVGVTTLPRGRQSSETLYVSGNQYALYAPLKPGRYQAMWEVAKGEQVKGGRLPPTTAPVSFEILPTDSASLVSAANSVPYGPARGGLRTRVFAQGTKFPAGSPIVIGVEMKNVGQQERRYYQPVSGDDGCLTVQDGAGKAAPYLCGSVQTMNPKRPLAPGRTTLLGTLDLTEYYLLLKPGTYTVKYVGDQFPPSNALSFEVVPAEGTDPLLRALTVLVENRPKEWHVVSPRPVSYLEQPGPQWSRVHCRRYTFEHKDQYADGLKPPKTEPVSLWIATQRAVKEPWQLSEEEQAAQTEYCGECAFGHVYLQPPHPTALARWSALKDNVMGWLR